MDLRVLIVISYLWPAGASNTLINVAIINLQIQIISYTRIESTNVYVLNGKGLHNTVKNSHKKKEKLYV